MFSNDQNIETIGQLVDTLKHYIGLQKEYVQLSAVEKTVRVLTVLAVTSVICILLVFILIFLSFALAFALSSVIGEVAAFAVIAGIYVFALLLFLIFKKRWVERPLVKFLTSLLFD